MKILWLNAGLLLPLDKGGKLRTWHLMRHLAARHDITYLSFAEPSEREDYRTGMREVCRRLETIPRTDPAKGTLRFYADAARYLVDPVPYAVAKYRSPAYAARLRELLRTEAFDAVVCDFLPPLVNLPATLPCPTILFTHNVEAEIWRRHAENATNPGSRYLLGQQWQRMLRFERAALKRFDLVLAVSEADGETFERLYPGALRSPVHVVQTGVDTQYFAPLPEVPPRPIAPRLHRLDGLAAERRRDDLLRPRHPAADPPRRAGRDAEHHRPRTDAGGPPARGRARASKSPAAWTTCGRTSRPAASTSCRCGSAAARG